MTTLTTEPIVGSLKERASEAAEIAARFADDVDEQGRFPVEAFDAIRRLGLLAEAVPTDQGGRGVSLFELSTAASIIGTACASTGMIFAMHQIQVLSLLRHDHGNAGVQSIIRQVVEEGALLASATTEIGIGGNTRTSSCCVIENEDGTVTLEKNAPVISYGAYATAVLATARRTPDSLPSDQVMVVCPADSTTLDPTSEWNTLGFRGTCSPGFILKATVDRSYIVDDDFATISARTMLPVSHVLWAAVWLGMATSAVDKARMVVRKAVQRDLGTKPPSAQRLAELLIELQSFTDIVESAARRFDENANDATISDSISYAAAMNGLKITASETVARLVDRALLITGISGYRLDSNVSLGRTLRDSHGAAIMVNNDRILANNTELALLSRGRR
jgi:acyl-CoA dehydrogenase